MDTALKTLIDNQINYFYSKKTFDISIDLEIPGYSEPDQYVPEIDKNYHFDEETNLAILAGFKYLKLSANNNPPIIATICIDTKSKIMPPAGLLRILSIKFFIDFIILKFVYEAAIY